MASNYMVKVYADLIRKGKKTIEEVPDPLQAAVREILENSTAGSFRAVASGLVAVIAKPHGFYFRVVREVSFYAFVISAAVHAEPVVGRPVFSEELCKSGVRSYRTRLIFSNV